MSVGAVPSAFAEPPKTVRVAVGDRYGAGGVHRFAFGGGYRDLWKAKIELPLLDLGTGGGLTPRGRHGGLQTAVLAFKGADGRSYTFRGTDKDPSAVLPALLRKSDAIAGLVRDQTSAQHPGGPIVAAVLSQAAGVLTIRERLVVIPDDPRLGKYRKEFAGMVGSFYEYPQPASKTRPGFHGASEVINHKQLYARLKKGHADQVDTKAFLRARLLDMLLGDFDRHRKQWRWARLPGDRRWQPIPEDRDQAFVRYDGAVQVASAVFIPILQCYGPEYPNIEGLTLHGWEQDRWLLTGLTWADWKPIVKDLRKRLDNAVIDRAIKALPPEYVRLDGVRLAHDIRGRRDKLGEAARAFYEHLAGAVDVHGTDEAERVVGTWKPNGHLLLEMRAKTAPAGAPPVFSRDFDPADTDEIRLYLRGGDDIVKVVGPPGGILLRVIAASGKKLLDDSAAGDTELYDQNHSTTVRPGSGTDVDRSHYERPPSEAGFVDVANVPPRDWGDGLLPVPILGVEGDIGLLFGAGLVYTDYGFRKHPWSSRHKVGAAFSTGILLPVVSYSGEFRPQNSEHLGVLDVRYTGIEIVNFHGQGNETANDRDDDYYQVRNHQVSVAPGFTWNLFERQARVSVMPYVKYSATSGGGRLVNAQQPYGSGSFGSVGAIVHAVIDKRESLWDESALALALGGSASAGYPTGGFVFDLKAELSPPVWDVEEPWASVSSSLAVYWATGDGRLAASARVGGQFNFGKTPYFGAAYVGGGGGTSTATARGYGPQRFGGKASLFGNFDVRLFIARFTLAVPIELGIHGFVDAARVFVNRDESNDWHPSGGGGFWIAPLARTNALSFSFAGSDEGLRFYFKAGFFY